jgi:predicted Zn-dependent protease
VQRDAYLERIDGLVIGDDPRNGVAQGSGWMCARCGFALQAPSGWSGQCEDGSWTAKSGSGRESLVLRRVGAAGGMLATAYIGALQSRPFVQQELQGVRVLSGTMDSKGQTVPAALLEAGADMFVLATDGDRAGLLLEEVLGSLRRVRHDTDGPRPSRLRVRAAAVAGPFEAVARATCGSFAPADKLATLNGIAPGERVQSGYRLKCVAPGSP